MNEHIAEETSLLLIRVSASLDDHLLKLRNQCDVEEFERHRLVFGKVMSGLLDILNSIYAEHPSLKPEQMDGPYVVPESVFK
jgi:hypothetical protein